MYTYPYQILKKRLTDTLPELKVVDWFLDQFSKSDKSTQVLTAPGVYLQVRPLSTEQLSFGYQMAEAEIVLHLFSINMHDNDKRVQKVNADDHAVLVDKAHKAVSGFSARLSYLPAFAALLNTPNDKLVLNSLRRVGVNPPHSMKSVMVTELTYRALIIDEAGVKTYTTQPPGTIPATITVTIH
jgi:hypothetical protein